MRNAVFKPQCPIFLINLFKKLKKLFFTQLYHVYLVNKRILMHSKTINELSSRPARH